MESVGVRELRDQVSKLLRQVRNHGEVIELTERGETVARLVPVKPAPVGASEVAAACSDLDQLAYSVSERPKE